MKLASAGAMLFTALPEVRRGAMMDYLRHRTALLRRAAPGQAPVPVQRPMVSRFLVAGICAWLLLQPLTGRGEIMAATDSGHMRPTLESFHPTPLPVFDADES